MARKKKRKSKSKKRKSSTKRVKKRTDLEKLKEQQNALYQRVETNLETIEKQTGLSRTELIQTVQKYGYEAIPTLDGYNIAEPIFNQMVKVFKLYDKVSTLVERMDAAQSKLLVTELEQKTAELEARVKEIEDEEKFYTEKQKDKEGMTKMKAKYYAEKEFWEIKKAKAIEILEKDPDNAEAQAGKVQAELQLSILAKKRNKVRLQNVQPTITKWSQKIGKGINTVQDSIGEITKPFAEMGEMSGYGGKGSKSQGYDYAADWQPDKIFGGKGKGKGKKNYSWDSGF